MFWKSFRGKGAEKRAKKAFTAGKKLYPKMIWRVQPALDPKSKTWKVYVNPQRKKR